MDNLYVSKTQSPAFKGLYVSKKLLKTSERRRITKELLSLAEKKSNGTNLVQKMESEGKDVFLSRGRAWNSVRVDFVPKNKVYTNADNGIVFPTNKTTLAGIYRESADFKTQYVPEKKPSKIGNFIKNLVVGSAIVSGIGLFAKKLPEVKQESMVKNKVTQIMQKDSINKIIKPKNDTTMLATKIDKHI